VIAPAAGDAERRDRLRLIRSDRIGPIIFRELLTRFGTASAALVAVADLARRGGAQRLPRLHSASDAERELAAVAKLGGRMVLLGDPEYPPALGQLDDAPPALTVRGRVELLAKPCVAIVGARNASANGMRFARQLAAELGAAGFVVVSGFARGIDSAAHHGALQAGTAGVMAGGVDVVYPPENQDLYGALIEAGAALSEQPCGTAPLARHFPQRNRLVSGMSLGVIVVEAAVKSGSLITARRALDQGRELFAVPGSPLDPRARGANELIRGGATLIQGADDVLEVLRPQIPRRPTDVAAGLPDGIAEAPAMDENSVAGARTAVLEMISSAPTPIDEIIRQCHLSPPVVLTAILELELAGRLQRHPGNHVSSVC
jgi:DNA processing protein